jgi:hypothetical protein
VSLHFTSDKAATKGPCEGLRGGGSWYTTDWQELGDKGPRPRSVRALPTGDNFGLLQCLFGVVAMPANDRRFGYGQEK